MIALETVKIHLKIDESSEADDAYLQFLIDGAISEFNNACNRTLYAENAVLPSPVGNALIITKDIAIGALMLLGHWFNNRESVVIGASVQELPMSTRAMWAKYRWANV
jgi:hypothetical protein